MRRSTLRACSSCWARASRRAKTSRERMGSCGDRGLAIADCGLGAGKSAIRNRQSAITAAPAARNSRRSIVLAPPGGGAYIMAPPVPQEGDVRMSFETRIEPLDGKLPKVSYRWDPETDILSVACKGVAKATGFDGTVDLEGDDGSFVLLDVVGGVLRGVEVVSWPDDVRTLDALAVPEPTKDGRVVFASRKSQPGVAADEGKLLHVLLRAVGATRVLELGALAGYSGVWLARALPPHGRLTTIEQDPRHAALARRAYAEAGVAPRVQLLEGSALDLLPTLATAFDAVFLDADKAPLPQYFEWSLKLLRDGGLLLCDNAFFHGAVVDPADTSPDAEGVRAFNRLAATDPRVVAAAVPIRDGLVVGVKVSE